MSGVETGIAVWVACLLMAGLGLIAYFLARHEHERGEHPNGRCRICGASISDNEKISGGV